MKRLLMYAIVLCLILPMATHSQTWTSLNGPKLVTNTKAITLNSSGTPTLYVADDTYVMKSTDGGSTWKGTVLDYDDPVATACKYTDATIVVSTRSGNFRMSSNGGSNWNTVTSTSGNIETNLVPFRLTAATATLNEAIMFLGRKYYEGYYSVWRSTTSGSTWSPSTDFEYEADVYDIATYPASYSARKDYVYACGVNPGGTQAQSDPNTEASINGVFFSPNNGTDWYTKKMGGYNTYSIAVLDKGEGNNYYVFGAVKGGTEHGVYRSTDGGDSFEEDPVFDDASVNIIRINSASSPKAIFLGTDDDVWRSTNDGADWTQVSSLGSDDDVISIAVSGSTTIFAGTAGSIYKSTDNGTTWADIGKMKVSSVDGKGSTVWAGSKDNAFIGKYSGSWTNSYISSAGASFSTEHLLRNRFTDDIFAAGSLGGIPEIQINENGSGSFSTVELAEGWTAGAGSFYRSSVDPVDYNDHVYFGGGAWMDDGNTVEWRNIFFSENEGDTWQPNLYSLGDGLPSPDKVYDYVVNDDDLRFVALSKGMVRRSSNGGDGWSTVLSASGVAYSVTLNPSVASKVYVGRSNGLFRSTDGGASFPSAIQNSDVRRVLMNPTYPTSGDHIYALLNTGSASDIKTSTNGGTNWSSMNTGIPGTSMVNDIQTSPYAGYLYAGTSTGVYAIDLVPAAPQGIAGSWSSTHPKIDWTANTEADFQAYDIYKYRRNCDYYNPPTHCGAPYSLSYLTTVTGTTYTDAMESSVGYDPFVVGYQVIAVDDGENESLPSAVEFQVATGDESRANPGDDHSEEQLPTEFSLSQNYPNPFNPTTALNYALPVDAHVTLKVYDMLGREVTTLVEEMQRAGYQSVEFDAGKLASGVYVYKITAGSFVDIKKMVVTK